MNRLEAIRARLEKATPGRLRWATIDPELDPVEVIRKNLSYGSGSVWAVIALDHPDHKGPDDRPEHCVTVAITGNGPNSENNADFFQHSTDDIRALLALADVLLKLREPYYFDKRGQVVCCYCRQELILKGHKDDCPWMQVVDVVKPLLEEVEL